MLVQDEPLPSFIHGMMTLNQLSAGLNVCEDNLRKRMERLRATQNLTIRFDAESNKPYPTITCAGCQKIAAMGPNAGRCVQCGRYVHFACLRTSEEAASGLGQTGTCRTKDCEDQRGLLYEAPKVTRLGVDLLT